MRFHPAADLFPLMEGEDFAALVADVAANGLREPIWRDSDDAVLDGRNRYRACVKAKVSPKFRKWTGDDPVAFVISMNLRRRHLNEEQRAMVAAKVANLHVGRPSKSGQLAGLPAPVTQAQAATMLNVSERSVRRAATVQERAIPEVVKAVEQGHLAVSVAERIARQPEPQQKRAAERVAKGEAPVFSVPKPKGKREKKRTDFDRAIDEAREWIKRWSHLGALSPIFDAITAVVQQSEGRGE